MNLIQEQKHVTVLCHLGNYFLDPLLKLTAVFGTSYHAGQIQSHDAPVRNGLRHIAAGDHLGQAFHNCGFAHARFPDQAWIILGSSA